MKYPETIKEQLLHAEDVMAHSENYLERSDENGNFPSKYEALRDLLANLMHYCDSQNISYNGVVNAAKWHYNFNNNLGKTA